MSSIPIKIIIDTNIIFMAWYNPLGKCAEVLRKAREGKINLFAPDTVKIEITRLFKKRNLSDEKIKEFLDDFPINWVEKEIYQDALPKTKVKHKADKPIEALALTLDCEVLSADNHFKNIKQKIEIDDLLAKLEKG
jgi:predicted nucleic acid-binding protein